MKKIHIALSTHNLTASIVEVFSQETDVNGILWESFNEENQLQEIRDLWPEKE